MAPDLVVVDTDLVIDFLRGNGPGASVVRDLISSGGLRLAAVTAFELRVGTDFHHRAAEILRLCHARTLPIDLPTALVAGEIGAELRSSGQQIGAADTLIAGTCRHHELPLATGNRRHFERVADLELLDLAP